MKILIRLLFIFGFFFIPKHLLACEFIIGWEEWPPYQYEENDQILGIDIDITRAVINAENCKATFKKMTWQRQLNSIKSGKIDLGAAASKTADREEFAYFTEKYRDETMSLFLRKGLKDMQIKDLKELEKMVISGHFKLGIVRGYHYGAEFGELLKNKTFKKNIQEVDNIKQNIIKCTSKRIDGFLGDKFGVTSMILKDKLGDKIVISDFDVNSDGVFFMLSKKSATPQKIKKLESGLRKIKDKGYIKQIKEKYMSRH